MAYERLNLKNNDVFDETHIRHIEDGIEAGITEETDPTVPSWAKASNKPTYSKSEVGLGNVDNIKQYSASNPPPYPVTEVNGKTGVVSLSASDVGAATNEQLDELSNAIMEIHTILNKNTHTEIQTLELDVVSGKYIKCNTIGSAPAIIDAGASSQFKYAKIPVAEGEVYYYSGRQNYEARAWVLVDSSNVSTRIDGGNQSSVNVIDDKIVIEAGEIYMYVGIDASFNYLKKEVTIVSDDKVSPLAGKKIIYDGDSICIGTYGNGGYANLIDISVKSTSVNQAVGGGRLSTRTGTTSSFHSIVDNLENLPTDGDLYCFEGGVNDVWSSVPLGTYSMSDYNGAVDETTICGALESIFRYSLNNFVGKPICFVISHKVSGISYENYKNYHDSAVAICNKYSIPFYDAYNESGLNGWNTTQNNAFLTGNAEGTPDGCHPNEEGYKRYYVPQLISLFERIMPVD